MKFGSGGRAIKKTDCQARLDDCEKNCSKGGLGDLLMNLELETRLRVNFIGMFCEKSPEKYQTLENRHE